MTYPTAGYENATLYGRQDTDVLRDLEYFRQLYPAAVRRYQTRTAEILDKMDYEGSVIYDEYPDRYTLERLADNVVDILRREENGQDPEQTDAAGNWEQKRSLIFVLLMNEVYKRRRGGRRGFFSFS
ncbi:MAG: hypothetical protein K1W26_11320 [Acetatifactor sp.]